MIASHTMQMLFRSDIHSTDDVFRTSDYGVVGFVDALGFEHSRLELNGRQVLFCFQRSPQLVSAIEKYLSNSPIACRDYFRGLRKAKTIIQDTIRDNANNSYRN